MRYSKREIRNYLYRYIEKQTNGRYTKQQMENGVQVPPLTEEIVVGFVLSMEPLYSEEVPF